MGSAQIDDEILELSQLTTESYARGLIPINITPTPGGPETTVTGVLEAERVKRSIFKTKLRHFVMVRTRSEKPDYASSAKFRQKLKIMLGLLNYAENYAGIIDKA